MKRLRKKYGAGIRFYMCGEYGPKLQRPHYHACLFNHRFDDLVLWKPKTEKTEALYRSSQLEDLWTHPQSGTSLGYSSVGSLTFESAAYVARYIMKKITGEQAYEHYGNLAPEYTDMSRRPGIGKNWFERYSTDVYPHDFIVMNGKKLKPPEYYDGLYELQSPENYKLLKEAREKAANRHLDNNSTERLKVREKIALKKLQLLPRNL
ncbi:replication initiator protein [Microviridae sp.]|nr:replication initiator protein [Microviridae sp.]